MNTCHARRFGEVPWLCHEVVCLGGLTRTTASLTCHSPYQLHCAVPLCGISVATKLSVIAVNDCMDLQSRIQDLVGGSSIVMRHLMHTIFFSQIFLHKVLIFKVTHIF